MYNGECKMLEGDTISSVCEQVQDILKWLEHGGSSKDLSLIVNFDIDRQKYFGLLFDNEENFDVFKCLAEGIKNRE